jgi:peroxiredoxin
MLKRFLFVFLLLSLFIGCSAEEPSSMTSEEQADTSLVLEREEQWGNAPDFSAVKVGGGEFKLSSLKGKVILLNFWSVGCPVCKIEIPVFRGLYDKYNDKGLEIVGVCLDRETIVKTFAKQMKINYTLVLANREIAREYRREILFIPVTFVIDKEGNIAEKHVGYTPKSTLEREIKKLLNK